MNLEQIKTAVDAGQTVYWSNTTYTVIKDRKDQYLVYCTTNGCCWGLTWRDGVTLNGHEKQFYTI